MRTGPTWLQEYLLSRGDVCLPKNIKETFYFAEKFDPGEDCFARGRGCRARRQTLRTHEAITLRETSTASPVALSPKR